MFGTGGAQSATRQNARALRFTTHHPIYSSGAFNR